MRLPRSKTSGLQMCDVDDRGDGDDKVNLTASLLAKTEFGVSRVVARVNDARNEWLFTEAWGVDVAVRPHSSRRSRAQSISATSCG